MLPPLTRTLFALLLLTFAGCDTTDPGSGVLSARITACPEALGVDEEGLFEATASGQRRSTWNFGDGTTASGLSASHSFADSGTYTVAFTAQGSGGEATEDCTVTVVGPADVEGFYDVEVFRFTPSAQAISPANVLDKLDQDETFFELIETQRGGQFQFRYRLAGELADLINGDFSVDSDGVDMVVREEDRPSLAALLLDSRFTLARADEGALVLDITKTVNLETYDDELYGGAGLTAVQGRLEVRLARQGEGD